MKSSSGDARRFVAFLLAAALVSGCASVPTRPPEKVDCRTVYLFWPGVNHTGLLLRKEDFPVPAAVADWPKDALTDWAEVGFGSEEHLRGLTTGRPMPKWRVLLRTPGAVMVRPFPWQGDPADWKSTDLRLLRIELPDPEYKKLLTFIRDSLAYGPDGAPVLVYRLGGTALYASTFDYSFRFVCHFWIMRALREAGVAGPLGWPYLQEQVQEGYVSRYKKPDVCR